MEWLIAFLVAGLLAYGVIYVGDLLYCWYRIRAVEKDTLYISLDNVVGGLLELGVDVQVRSGWIGGVYNIIIVFSREDYEKVGVPIVPVILSSIEPVDMCLSEDRESFIMGWRAVNRSKKHIEWLVGRVKIELARVKVGKYGI